MKNKQTNKIKISTWFIMLCASLIALEPGISFAGDQSTQAEASTQATTQDQLPAAADLSQPAKPAYPYDKTFIISAYYSPLANQNKYVTGSFAGDVRLNGGGVHGADGSPVYPGMIAAPSGYAFGIKMKIPGIGVVAVHDRGGAIVHAGVRNQAYDRLDVWMGYGDVGLQRALNWGRRTVDVTVYGQRPDLKEEVYLEGYSAAEKFVQAAFQSKPALFSNDLEFGDQSDAVKSMQSTMKTLGYYKSEPTGKFDDSTQKALMQFQIDSGVIDTPLDFGAGYFGPQSRRELESALTDHQTKLKNHLPQTSLGKDDQGAEVKKLQTALKRLNYNVDVNGVFDNKTVEAIFKFQKDNQIIDNREDQGAGFFGPKTMQILADKLNTALTQINSDTIVVANAFDGDLQLGSKGANVTKLQQELKRLNLLAIEPSGFYGDVTAHAVFKFQQIQGLAGTPSSMGAGVFGKLTRARLNSLVGQRERTARLIADKRRENLNDTIAMNQVSALKK
ncbi:MAG: peptidoglycan-binding protein [Candidatus Gracilibacteria bacterium]|jgi:peptidoglycan hydrolase-like protein with peptidoglycan-binding domain/3D (Asp-Asp-Asp) domain-containing protein